MAGRIRTMKPEILDDEKTAGLTDAEFRMFSGIILLSDDHGSFRANPRWLASQIWWDREPSQDPRECLATLSRVGLVTLYENSGQVYGHVTNWSKHQKVDKPSKPRLPQINDECSRVLTCGCVTVCATDSRDCAEAPDTDLRSPISDPDPDLRPTCAGSDPESTDAAPNLPGFEPAEPPPDPVKPAKVDLDPDTLTDAEGAAYSAIVQDETLEPICKFPVTLARDLVAAGPALNVALEVRKAGTWLRANPKNAKKDGNRFLANWVMKAQDRAPRVASRGDRIQPGGWDSARAVVR